MDKNLRTNFIKKTKKLLSESIPRDIFIIQTIHTIDELIKIINKVITNLRERYGYHAPKVSKIEDITNLFREIKKHNREEAGIEFNNEDLISIDELIKGGEELIILKDLQEKYLDSLMKKQCPELLKVSTALIGARLISLAGSLKRLAELPSSTIQVLGAEKALFRHIKTGAKPPKFGVIFAHPDIQNAEEKSKAARKLSAKISIAVKKDYFRKTNE